MKLQQSLGVAVGNLLEVSAGNRGRVEQRPSRGVGAVGIIHGEEDALGAEDRERA